MSESNLKLTSIQVDKFNGDVSVSRNIAMGGNFLAQGNAHIKKNLRVDGYIDAKNFKGPNKGLFKDLDSLEECYPNPENGWWALVGNTLPAQLHIAINGKWTDSGFIVGNGLEVDLDSVNGRIDSLEQLLQEIKSSILTFDHKYNDSTDYSFIEGTAVGDRNLIIYFTDKKGFYCCIGELAFSDWHNKDLYMKNDLPRGDKLYSMNNRLYQYDGEDVVLLGSDGNSKPIDVLHSRGNNKTATMSQDAITRELTNVEEIIRFKERCPVFDGFIFTEEIIGKSAAVRDGGKIMFDQNGKAFVYQIDEKHYGSWIDNSNILNNEYLYNHLEDGKLKAIPNKIFICNNKLYFWNGEEMIVYEDALPDYYPDDQNKSLTVDGNGNLQWSSANPVFFGIVDESALVRRVTDDEFKNADNLIYFLNKGHFTNYKEDVFPIFAKKDSYGRFIIPTSDNLIKDYNFSDRGIVTPIPNKIFTYAADGQQYVYDGTRLRLLTDGQQMSVTYSELKQYIDSNSLIPGLKYRITDFTTYKTTYHTTKIGSKEIPTLSDKHRFDIIVTASSNNTLESKASAVLSRRDNYFSNFNCKLEKWELEYMIEPDENIRDDYYTGTITYMKDEHGNEATYDFKNIMFDVSGVETLSDYLNTTKYDAKKIKPIYTFTRIIKDVREINGINLIWNAYYGLDAPDCYVADGSLCNEYEVVFNSSDNIYKVSFDTVENNIIKLKQDFKAIFACGNAYLDGFTVKYGINKDFTFDIKHKADHNLIINAYGNSYDKNGATVFIIGSVSSFINVNGMLTDNHCMNLHSSYVCVTENGKQTIDISSLDQRFNRINDELYNISDQQWSLYESFEEFKNLNSGNFNNLVSRVSVNEKAITNLNSMVSANKQSIMNLNNSVSNAENLKQVTYKEFITLLNNESLIPGTQYHITNFVNYYRYDIFANRDNFMPVIVTADSNNTINPYAKLADGSTEIKIQVITKSQNEQFNFEGSICTVLSSSNTVTYNGIIYIELYLKVTNYNIYHYVYVRKDDWDNIHNSYGSVFYVDYYHTRGLDNTPVSKGTKFDPSIHLIQYMNRLDYKPDLASGSKLIEIIWMRDSNGNEAPWNFVNINHPTFSENCKNNIIKIPYWNDYIRSFAGISLSNCQGNNITFTGNRIDNISISDCNYNDIYLDPSIKVTLNEYNNSRIVCNDADVQIYKKDFVHELGDSKENAISQYGVNEVINEINTNITNLETNVNNTINEVKNEANEYTDGIIDSYVYNSSTIILPVQLMNTSVSDITVSSELPENPSCVYYNISNRKFYAKDNTVYHTNWDSFIKKINNTYNYFPSSEAYTKNKVNLLRDISSNSVWGSLLIACTQFSHYKLTPINENFFDSEFIEASETKNISVYNKQNCFVELNNNSSCKIKYHRASSSYYAVSNVYRPVLTSQLIIKTSNNPTITFDIPTVINEVIWENEAPPIFENYMYYVFNFTEMYIEDTSSVKLLITYKSFPYTNPNVEYIDLGLPSGTLWATKNVGATSPEEYGGYYAWGEIETKDEYTSDNCLTDGIELSDVSGNAQYDAATANLDETWRMPTQTEIEELITNCTLEAATLNDIVGYKITGSNGNSIFLPSGGYKYGTSAEYEEISFYCWSSTPSGNYSAYELKGNSENMLIETSFRNYGMNIRPIKIINE